MREAIPSSVDSSSWLRRVGPLTQPEEVLQQGIEAGGSGTPYARSMRPTFSTSFSSVV